MGFFDFLKNGSKKPSTDLSDFKFVSDDHIRIQNGQDTKVNNKGAWRGLRIQTTDNKIFTATIYNLTGTHPIWGDNVQMSPKQMKLVEDTGNKISLRGFGVDARGASFADYGFTLHKQGEDITKVTLHMFDRNTEIHYHRGDPSDMNKPTEVLKTVEIKQPVASQNLDNATLILKNFKLRWDSELSMQDKMVISMQSDNLNNQGCNDYENGDTDNAIANFSQALQIMPINDDALLNLARSYNRIGKYNEAVEQLRKINFLYPNAPNKNKAIAYSLLYHLIKEFDSDGGAVDRSTLVDFMKTKFQFVAADNEIKKIINIINEPFNRDIIVHVLGGGFGIGADLSTGIYMTSDGTDLSTIIEEIKDVLNWD